MNFIKILDFSCSFLNMVLPLKNSFLEQFLCSLTVGKAVAFRKILDIFSGKRATALILLFLAKAILAISKTENISLCGKCPPPPHRDF